MSPAPAHRLGILGGSFDPVHLGHLLAAQDAFEHMELDRVIFMPAAQAPLKGAEPRLAAAGRLELLRAALAGDGRFSISTLEIDRGGVNYSIDTARALSAENPGARLFWIVGADQAARLGAWREIEALGALVEFIVLARPGFAVDAGSAPSGVRLHPVPMHVFDVSSTEIRARLAAGRPVEWFLPGAVATRIEQERLYR